VSVGTWLDGEFPGGAAGEPQALAWPLDVDALEELRWYLEDYLRAPFGVYESRGPAAQATLPAWGEAVFGAVFGPGPARDAYQRMRARPAGVQVVFRSGAARWLGLAWDLMHDPARELPLALDAGVSGIDRSLPAAELGAAFDVAGSGRLRVLMVISRPSGAADVGFRMIARPLLERLEAVRGRVEAIKEKLDDRASTAVTYSKLGLIAEEKDDPDEALKWTVRCVALFDDVPHPGSGTGPDQLARLAHQLGFATMEACWQRVTRDALPDAVRHYVRTYRPNNGNAFEGADR